MSLMFPGNTGVCTVISRWHDRPDHDASTTRRAVPVYAVLILALALLMAGFQPWNHGFSSNTAVMDGAGSALALSADCGRSDRNAGMPAASQCLLHAACAVSLGCDACSRSRLPPTGRYSLPVLTRTCVARRIPSRRGFWVSTAPAGPAVSTFVPLIPDAEALAAADAKPVAGDE